MTNTASKIEARLTSLKAEHGARKVGFLRVQGGEAIAVFRSPTEREYLAATAHTDRELSRQAAIVLQGQCYLGTWTVLDAEPVPSLSSYDALCAAEGPAFADPHATGGVQDLMWVLGGRVARGARFL